MMFSNFTLIFLIKIPQSTAAISVTIVTYLNLQSCQISLKSVRVTSDSSERNFL